MIKGSDLENRAEGDAKFRPRKIENAAEVDAAITEARADAARVIEALQQRIAAARRVLPSGRDLHCRDCFMRGRDAALRVIDGEESR